MMKCVEGIGLEETSSHNCGNVKVHLKYIFFKLQEYEWIIRSLIVMYLPK